MPRPKKPAAAKAPNPSFAFLLDYMKKNAKAVYADAAEAAKKAGHTIYPIVWGRAQALLGRVKSKPRGTGKAAVATRAAKAETAGEAPAPRRRGRPPGSRNKVRESAPATRGRPARAATNGGVPIDAADLDAWMELVGRLNSGARVALRFDGSRWLLAVA